MAPTLASGRTAARGLAAVVVVASCFRAAAANEGFSGVSVGVAGKGFVEVFGCRTPSAPSLRA